MIFNITIYPRKGTETFLFFVMCGFIFEQITTYPRKGTKTSSGVKVIITLKLQLIPRKGTTKHLRHWHLPAAEVLCFILILFTGYRAGVVPAEMVIVTGSALTP